MPLSPLRRAGSLALLIALSLVTASCARGIPVQTYPSNADLQAVTEPKPRPTPDIVTDPQANARYDAEVESYAERVQAAGVRICTWAESMGAKLPFDCRR